MAPSSNSFGSCPSLVVRGLKGLLALALCAPALCAQQAAAPDDGAAAGARQVFGAAEFFVDAATGANAMQPGRVLGAMRAGTLLVDSPASVTILPGSFAEEFALAEIEDLFSFAAGGNLAGERQDGTGGYATLRGFKAGVFRNGLARGGITEIVNLERVEFVKGPSAAALGFAGPGGAINYITQRPLREKSTSLKTRFGSLDYQRYEAHVNTGPVGSDKVFARVDMAYTDRGGLQDCAFRKTFAASAAVAWQPTSDTVVMVEVERARRDQNARAGGAGMFFSGTFKGDADIELKYSGTTGFDLPASTIVTGGIHPGLERAGFNPQGADSLQITKVTTVEVRGEHRLGDFLSVQATMQWWNQPDEAWMWTTTDSNGAAAGYSFVTRRFDGRDPYRESGSTDCKQGQIDVVGTLKLGPTAHRLVFTCDVSGQKIRSQGWKMSAADRAALPPGVLSLNPANPDYSGFDKNLLMREVESHVLRRNAINFQLSDHMAIGGRALVFASLRRNNAHTGYSDKINQENTAHRFGGDWCHSLGGNLKLSGDKIILFASHNASTTPSTTRDRGTGALMGDITARGYEAGFKGALAEHKLYWTVSAFRIDGKGIPQVDPSLGSDFYFKDGAPQYIGAGWERNDGLEAELCADPVPGWSVKLAGSYVDARTRAPAPGDEERKGKRLLGVPRRSGSAAVMYEFQSGPPRGLRIGASARYTDEYCASFGGLGSQVTGSNLITQQVRNNYGDMLRIEEMRPTVVLYDMFMSYQFKMGGFGHVVNAGIRNITNKTWWSVSGHREDGRAYYVRYDLQF